MCNTPVQASEASNGLCLFAHSRNLPNIIPIIWQSSFSWQFANAGINSDVAWGELPTPNFWLSKNCQKIFLSKSFCLKIQNLGLKAHVGEIYGKIGFLLEISAACWNSI